MTTRVEKKDFSTVASATGFFKNQQTHNCDPVASKKHIDTLLWSVESLHDLRAAPSSTSPTSFYTQMLENLGLNKSTAHNAVPVVGG